MSAHLAGRVLLVFLGLYFVAGAKEDDVKFNLRINEKGTRFVEKIKINEKENTATFSVPRHNDVDHSEVLHLFNLNLTVTRLPDAGVCYIKPLDEMQTSSSKMKSDINHVRRMHGRNRKPDILLRSTQWVIGEKLKIRELRLLSAFKFCAGFPVYRLKEINKDNVKIEEEETYSNGSASRSKRQDVTKYPVCPESRTKEVTCPPTQWSWFCKFRTRSCVYWTKCQVGDIIKRTTFSLRNCNFVHDLSSVICCEFRCP